MLDEFMLPKTCYGTICIKILKDFIEHHNLPSNLPLPENGDYAHIALQKIFSIMLLTLDEEKRKEIKEDAKKYYQNLPPSAR